MTTEQARQPLLNDATVVLRAPSQAWSAVDGRGVERVADALIALRAG